MFSFMTAVIVFCVILGTAIGLVLAVTNVMEHARQDPAAAKAIYEHVFLPIFVGTPDAKTQAAPVVTAAKPSESEPER